jgi:hypothetical protein
MIDHEPPFSVSETAEAHGWSRKRVYRLIHEGCPTIRIGRQHLIFPNSLDQFLRQREVPGHKDPPSGRGRPRKSKFAQDPEIKE